MRLSKVLRGILSDNPGVKTFSVERILASIGDNGFEASLMMFSLPALVPVPRPMGMVALPAGAIACQMAAGREKIRLPRFIRKKSVSRRALAVSIHAILPVLEAAEKVVRPRWSWVTHSLWRRAIGLFVLLMVIGIAFPLFGFNSLHATSIFVISLGMAEKDGLAVMVGVFAGVLSLAIIAFGLSLRTARSKVFKWLWKISGKLGLLALAKYLDRLGHEVLAKILSLPWSWSTLLLKWDPEKRAAERARTGDPAGHHAPKEQQPHRDGERAKREKARAPSTVAASLSNALA
jgi:hypothetical protein